MDTPRTMELGRAVIVMQSANIELWLTTLITLSPDTNNPAAQHYSGDLQRNNPNQILDHLSSGNVWVRRGNDMCMSFHCTELGVPLDSHHLRQLGDCIVNAPAWQQLGLCLSMPLNYEPTHGKLRVNIEGRREYEQSSTTNEGSTESSQIIDIRPPDSVPVLNLESVEFVMAICETRTRAMARKRPKRETAKPASEFGEAEHHGSGSLCRLGPLTNSACQSEVVDQGQDTHVQSRLLKTPSRPPLDLKPGSPYRGKRKGPATSSELAIEVTDHVLPTSARIVALTDAALRFSTCLNLRGFTTSLKVKANTFIYSLTNVAPALWRAGYVSTCAHVMYTAPTITRSLDRISLSARSTTLKAKFAVLKNSPIGENYEQGLGGYDLVGGATSTITDRLWRHVQRTQLSKSTFSSIQTLCDPRFQADSAEAAVEILEECRDLGTKHAGENDERLHGPKDCPFDMEQSCKQNRLNRMIRIEAIEPMTNTQNGSNVCPASDSMGTAFSTFISRALNGEADDEGEKYFECDRPVTESLLDEDRTACVRASADIPQVNELASPRTNQEDMLFTF